MISIIYGEKADIQFGAEGPFIRYSLDSLRWATSEELRDAEMDGIGRAASPVDNLTHKHHPKGEPV